MYGYFTHDFVCYRFCMFSSTRDISALIPNHFHSNHHVRETIEINSVFKYRSNQSHLVEFRVTFWNGVTCTLWEHHGRMLEIKTLGRRTGRSHFGALGKTCIYCPLHPRCLDLAGVWHLIFHFSVPFSFSVAFLAPLRGWSPRWSPSSPNCQAGPVGMSMWSLGVGN